MKEEIRKKLKEYKEALEPTAHEKQWLERDVQRYLFDHRKDTPSDALAKGLLAFLEAEGWRMKRK